MRSFVSQEIGGATVARFCFASSGPLLIVRDDFIDSAHGALTLVHARWGEAERYAMRDAWEASRRKGQAVMLYAIALRVLGVRPVLVAKSHIVLSGSGVLTTWAVYSTEPSRDSRRISEDVWALASREKDTQDFTRWSELMTMTVLRR